MSINISSYISFEFLIEYPIYNSFYYNLGNKTSGLCLDNPALFTNASILISNIFFDSTETAYFFSPLTLYPKSSPMKIIYPFKS